MQINHLPDQTLPPAASVDALVQRWMRRTVPFQKPHQFGAIAGWCVLGLTGAHLAGKSTAAVALQALGFTVLDTMAVVRADAAQHWPEAAPLLNHPDAWYAVNVRLQSLAVARCPHAPFAEWVGRQGLALAGSRSAAWVLQQWQAYRLATDLGYWMSQRCAALRALLEGGERLVVVDAVLTPPEADWIHALDGAVVCISRPAMWQAPLDPSVAWDGHVLNDGTPDRLSARLLNVALQLYGPQLLRGVQ